MSSLPPVEPQPPTFGDPQSQAAAERNAPAQPAWHESTSAPSPSPYRPTYPPQMSQAPKRRSRWYVWAIGGCLALVGVTILACAVLGGVFAGFLIHVANETPVSEMTQQSFSVTGTPSLDLQDTAGNISILQGSADTISLEVTKSARATTSDEARSDLNNIHVDVTQVGNTLKVATTFDESNGFGRQPRVDLRLTVPPTTNVSIQATTGDVGLFDISGLFNVNVVAGSLHTDGVTLADGSQLHVTTGNVEMNGSLEPGGSLDMSVDTGQASLALGAGSNAHLDARVNVGSIDISDWPLSTSKNNLGASAVGDLGAPPEGTITIRVQTGSIDISQA